MCEAYLACLAPVRAVGSPENIGVVVGCVLSGGGFRPGREGVVVGFKEGFSNVGGGHNDEVFEA